ncbi:hypothetical protein ACP70R_031958 [Stipagrostis hirtigluma subsp. patula]
MVVVVTPQDAGRPTARSEIAEVADVACRWAAPIFEATKLPSSKDKMYQFLSSPSPSLEIEGAEPSLTPVELKIC